MAKEKSYTVENLQEAVLLVRNKSLTAYQAQKRYNIPKTTLHAKIKGSHGKKYGREIVLSVDLENQLADWVCMCAASGSPKTTKKILEAAKDLASLVGRKFKGGIPSSGWLKG